MDPDGGNGEITPADVDSSEPCTRWRPERSWARRAGADTQRAAGSTLDDDREFGAAMTRLGLVAVVLSASSRTSRMMGRGLAVMGGLGWMLLTPTGTLATHGSAGLPAVIESERLANGAAPGACRVAGVVWNPSLSETVTVRLSWQGMDTVGSPAGMARARIPALRPGERRPFTSGPFVGTNGQTLPSCEGLAHLVRLDAIAEPVPVP
jgi:hypothetical protein